MLLPVALAGRNEKRLIPLFFYFIDGGKLMKTLTGVLLLLLVVGLFRVSFAFGGDSNPIQQLVDEAEPYSVVLA